MDFNSRIKETFGFDKKKTQNPNMTFKEEDGLLEMELKLNMKKYKNRVSSYSEVLKEYFKSHEKIRVLTKVKENRGIKGIYAILFKNSKESVMSEMRGFSPNYLIERDKHFLLVTFESDYLKVFEIPSIENDRFIFRGYRYKLANEIKLK